MAFIANIAVNDYLDGEKRRFGYGFSVGYNSLLGPLAFSLAVDPMNNQVLTNVNLGYWF